MMKVNVFLDFDVNAIEAFLKDENSKNDLLGTFEVMSKSKNDKNDLEKYLEFILEQKEVQGFISTKLTEVLLEEDIEEYLGGSIECLNKLITQTEIWEKNSLLCHNSSIDYYEWLGNCATKLENNMIKAELAERQDSYGEICLLIQPKVETKISYILRNNHSVSPLQTNLLKISCSNFLNKEEFETWFNPFKRQLIFKHHTKHDYLIKRRKQKGSFVNRLLCSHEQAQELLLNSKLDDKKEKKRYNIDKFPNSDGFGKLIEFMPENLDNGTYHAYHLEDIAVIKDIDATLSYLSSDIRIILKKWLLNS